MASCVNGCDSNLKYERHGRSVRIYNPNVPKGNYGGAGSLITFDSKEEADAFIKKHTAQEKPSMSVEEARKHMALATIPGFGFFEMIQPEYQEAAKAWAYYIKNGMA